MYSFEVENRDQFNREVTLFRYSADYLFVLFNNYLYFISVWQSPTSVSVNFCEFLTSEFPRCGINKSLKSKVLSKILECTVATQLKSHFMSTSLLKPFQYGFHFQHSSETALLKATTDLLLSADSGHFSILILLDLTSAFDTINHSILLCCLESSLNITVTALSWLKSFFTNRQQFIHIQCWASYFKKVISYNY